MNWKDELKKKWHLHDKSEEEITFPDGTIEDFDDFTDCEEEVIDFIKSLLKQQREINDGEIWSAIRTLLSQGGSIQQDYDAGKYKNFEEYSIRLDAAARERIEWLKTKLNTEPKELKK